MIGQWRFDRLLAQLATMLAVVVAASISPPVRADAPKQDTYFFLVFSDPASGSTDADYNRCYNEIHGPDVTSIPGFVKAQRFIYADRQLREVALKKPRYLILYTVMTSDPAAVREEIVRRAKSGQTRQCPLANVKMYTYRAMAPAMKGVGGEPTDAKPGATDTYYQIVFGNAIKGMDAEFNHWYDTVHEPDLLKVPGFVDGQRAVMSAEQLAPTDEGPTKSQYLALFEMRTTDLGAVLNAVAHSGAQEPPPAFDRDRTWGYTYKAIGPAMDGDKIRTDRAASNKKS